MPRKIFLMRHADPENPDDLMYGNLPGFLLSELGIRQAEEAGKFMSQYKLNVVITSGLERARQTGEIIAETNPGHPQIIDDQRLRDLGIDAWEGKITKTEFGKEKRAEYWQRQLSGEEKVENPHDTQKRVVEAFDYYLATYPDKNILFVSHFDSLLFLIQALLGQPLHYVLDLPPGKISKADILEVELNPVVINKIFHLNEQIHSLH